MKNPDGIPYKVLICLKNEQICVAIHQYFTQMKAEKVVYAHNNKEATSKMSQEEYNLFIIGSEFPILGGIDFSNFIRIGDGMMAQAPIIMLMYEPDKKKVLSAINAGINEILVPPFNITKIKHHIKHLHNHPRPFVRRDSYSGPVRRGTDDMNYISA